MDVYVDATTLIALGNVGEVGLLHSFESEIVILSPVFSEITPEPARSNVAELIPDDGVRLGGKSGKWDSHCRDAREILGEDETVGDVAIITAVLRRKELAEPIGIVSDDRRVRTVAEGLGATVTGTIGVVVRAVHEGMHPEEAKEFVRRLDSQGLHMTGELRETAYRLVEDAAKEREEE